MRTLGTVLLIANVAFACLNVYLGNWWVLPASAIGVFCSIQIIQRN